MNIFYTLLSTFATEITMLKEMPIKNGDRHPPKTTAPICTPNTNMRVPTFQTFH